MCKGVAEEGASMNAHGNYRGCSPFEEILNVGESHVTRTNKEIRERRNGTASVRKLSSSRMDTRKTGNLI